MNWLLLRVVVQVAVVVVLALEYVMFYDYRRKTIKLVCLSFFALPSFRVLRLVFSLQFLLIFFL